MIALPEITKAVNEAISRGYAPVIVTTPRGVTEIGSKNALYDTNVAIADSDYATILFRNAEGEIYEVSLDSKVITIVSPD